MHVGIGEATLTPSATQIRKLLKIIGYGFKVLLKAFGKDRVGIFGVNQFVGNDFLSTAEPFLLEIFQDLRDHLTSPFSIVLLAGHFDDKSGMP